jgi:hypothetical protein
MAHYPLIGAYYISNVILFMSALVPLVVIIPPSLLYIEYFNLVECIGLYGLEP